MTRSRRKTPIIGMAGGRRASEKEDKQLARRRMRRINKKLLKTTKDYDRLLLKQKDEVSNPWTFRKDGKQYLGQKADPKDLRK